MHYFLKYPTRRFLFILYITLFSHYVIANDDIVIGTTTALSGPTKALGISMVRGMRAHFSEINQAGGIKQKKISFLTLDDAYNPASAKQQMIKLANNPALVAVIGNVGTPTANVTVPIAYRQRLPLIGVLSGANVLRRAPESDVIFNFRASYAEEMDTIINAIIDSGISATEIAFFTQNDSFGDAGYKGGIKALRKLGYTNTDDIIHARYPRNTLEVKNALLQMVISDYQPKAVIIIGTYGPAAKLIKKSQTLLPDTLFFNISFVGSYSLAKALDACCNNVYISQVVPPLDSDLLAVGQYKNAMKNTNNEKYLDDISFEGYLAAKMFSTVVEKITGTIDRESIIQSFNNVQSLDLGLNQRINFNGTTHQASHQTWLVKIVGKKIIASDWRTLGRDIN